MKNHTVQLAVMLVLGTAIGAIGAQLAGQGGQELRSSEGSMERTSTTSDEILPASGEDMLITETDGSLPGKGRVPANVRPGLTVADQAAGNAVSVSGFSLQSPQWVAVYDNREGMPGWILGAKRFLPGDASGIVPLLRSTVSGGTYYAVFHGDDGDLEFDKRHDPAPDADNALIVTFRAL